MNPYNPDGGRRVVACLLTISIPLAGLIHTGLDAVNFELGWLISVPSAVVIYKILYHAFDRFIWRWCPLRQLDLVTVPDLNGEWRGQIKSSYGSDDRALQVSVVITQRWSKILVRLEAEESHSKSIAASFLTDDPSSPELVYVYENEPASLAPEPMQAHGGTARLRLVGSDLRGKYYTGRGRGTVGDITLQRG